MSKQTDLINIPGGKLELYGSGISDIPLAINHAWGSSSTALISASAASSEVFKVGRDGNLTLSGGIYLGGNGSANYLDDYEEGTWTPTAVSNCTIPTIHNAGYTKVGNQVHLSFWIKTSNTASNIVLSGLPFEVTTNQRFTGAASDVLNLNNISTQILYLNLYFYNVPTGTNRDLMFGVSYKTNS
jgi:hypothetical protein